jgi:hypothetical protein
MHISLIATDLGFLRDTNAETGRQFERLARVISDDNVTCTVLTGVPQPVPASEADTPTTVHPENPALLIQEMLAQFATKVSVSWTAGAAKDGIVRGTAVLSQLPVLNTVSHPGYQPDSPPAFVARLALALTEDLDLVGTSIENGHGDSGGLEELLSFLDEVPALFSSMSPKRRPKRGRPTAHRDSGDQKRMRITCLAGRLCGLTREDRALLSERGFYDATQTLGFSTPCGAIFIHPAVRAKRVESYAWTVPDGEEDPNPAILAEFEL